MSIREFASLVVNVWGMALVIAGIPLAVIYDVTPHFLLNVLLATTGITATFVATFLFVCGLVAVTGWIAGPQPFDGT